jgi:hypothetical protein
MQTLTFSLLLFKLTVVKYQRKKLLGMGMRYLLEKKRDGMLYGRYLMIPERMYIWPLISLLG